MSVNTILPPIQTFDFVSEENGSLLLLNKELRIVKIEWHGRVDAHTASEILNKGADLIEKGICTRLLLNRKELDEFTKEARQWIKDDLLKKRAKSLVHKVEKVATVKSVTKMGNLFATILSTATRIVFPGLKMNNFDTEEEAISWMVEPQRNRVA
ncbi:STAS/SEC14 domain-containing protein [Ekhidna sp.]